MFNFLECIKTSFFSIIPRSATNILTMVLTNLFLKTKTNKTNNAHNLYKSKLDQVLNIVIHLLILPTTWYSNFLLSNNVYTLNI